MAGGVAAVTEEQDVLVAIVFANDARLDPRLFYEVVVYDDRVDVGYLPLFLNGVGTRGRPCRNRLVK